MPVAERPAYRSETQPPPDAEPRPAVGLRPARAGGGLEANEWRRPPGRPADRAEGPEGDGVRPPAGRAPGAGPQDGLPPAGGGRHGPGGHDGTRVLTGQWGQAHGGAGLLERLRDGGAG